MKEFIAFLEELKRDGNYETDGQALNTFINLANNVAFGDWKVTDLDETTKMLKEELE